MPLKINGKIIKSEEINKILFTFTKTKGAFPRFLNPFIAEKVSLKEVTPLAFEYFKELANDHPFVQFLEPEDLERRVERYTSWWWNILTKEQEDSKYKKPKKTVKPRPPKPAKEVVADLNFINNKGNGDRYMDATYNFLYRR